MLLGVMWLDLTGECMSCQSSTDTPTPPLALCFAPITQQCSRTSCAFLQDSIRCKVHLEQTTHPAVFFSNYQVICDWHLPQWKLKVQTWQPCHLDVMVMSLNGFPSCAMHSSCWTIGGGVGGHSWVAEVRVQQVQHQRSDSTMQHSAKG